jgi:ATP-dependent Clp endopeptidase proteolytic subunit ClpP
MRNSIFNRSRDSRPDLRIVHNGGSDEAEVTIYDEIGPWYGVNAKEFVSDIKALDVKTIRVRINSPGGSVFDAVAIANALREHSAHVVTHVDGIAASAASFIATAGNEVRMADNAFIMVHDPSTFGYGNAADFRKLADTLDKVGDMIANEYVKRTGQTLATVKQWMSDETWFSAEEAQDVGLVDHVDGTSTVNNTFDLSVFAHAPAALTKPSASREKRDLEVVLREAGLSRSEAKRVAALASAPPQRDAGDGSEALATDLQALLQAFSSPTL